MRDLRLIPILLLLGFASGLPSDLLGTSLQYWMKECGLTIDEIAQLGAVAALPFTLKFLWAPVVDRFAPLPIGRRRGWILLAMLGLCTGLMTMAAIDPIASFPLFLLTVGGVACASATLDIAINGYTCDAVDGAQSAPRCAGASVWGYRSGMLASTSLAPVLAMWFADPTRTAASGSWAGWPIAYAMLTAGLLVTLIALPLGKEPVSRSASPTTLSDAVRIPLQHLHRMHGSLGLGLLLAFALLYRLPDQWAANQQGTFFKILDFTAADIALARGPVGLLAAGLGIVLAGLLALRLSAMRLLLYAGLIGATSNLVYVGLDARWLTGTTGLCVALGIEQASGGFLGAVFVGFLMSWCTSSCAATQYALLTAVYAFGKFLTAPAGAIASQVSWQAFFLCSIATALPGIVVLAVLSTRHARAEQLRN